MTAEVIAIADDPDGFNINDECGAVHPETLAASVLAQGADVGVALDGDADRLILVDETGVIVNGDQVLACLARDAGGGNAERRWRGRHGDDEWRHRAVPRQPRADASPQVGDHVLERMRKEGLNLGGESSGHILLTSHSTSGDGLIAALQMLQLLVTDGRPASQLFRAFAPNHQKLRNLKGIDPGLLTRQTVVDRLAAIEARIEGAARILVRPSGTESLIRVMVESESEARLDAVMQEIILLIETESQKS